MSFLAVIGCGGSIRAPDDLGEATGAPQKARALRYRRQVGPADRYQATYRIRVRNDLQSDESMTAQVFFHTTGKTTGDKSFDRVIIRRSEEKRNSVEVVRKGKVTRQDRTRNTQPAITPNFEAEPRTRGLYYIPFDELGRIGRRPETPYHYAWYDSLCYLFPVFPEKPVGLGDRWDYEFPVVVGRTNSNNVAALRATFRLTQFRALRRAGGRTGPLCAVIEYTYYALLDTDNPADAAKLPRDASGLFWRRNVVEGEGKVYFDIERGKVLWKRESYKLEVDAKTVRSTDKPKKDEVRAYDFLLSSTRKTAEPGVDRHHWTATVQFAARILAPGEKPTDKPSRID